MRFADFHPNVRLRIGLNFFTNLLSNMFTPFMAVYFAQTLGTTIAGFTTVLSIVVMLAFSTLGGHYADQIGRKKVMLLSETLCFASFLIMAAFNSPWMHSAVVTLVMAIIMNAGSGLSLPANDAMLIDVTTAESRKSMYRITYWSNNLSVSIAGMIGGYFFGEYLFQLFLACAAMSLITLFVTKVFIAETLHAEPGVSHDRTVVERKPSMWSNYLRVFRDRKFMIFITATLLTLSVERNLTNYIGIRLSEEMQGVPWLPGFQAQVNGLEMLGILRTENTLVCLLIPLLIGRWLNGKSGARTMFFAMAVNIIGYIYLSFGNQPSLLLLLMMAAAVGEIVYIPIKQALLVNIVPDDSRSSYMAVNSMGVRGSHILAGLNVMLGGYLSSGSMATIIGLTGIAGVFLLFLIASSLETRKPSIGKSEAI